MVGKNQTFTALRQKKYRL